MVEATPSNAAAAIIEKFGGTRALAAALNVPPSTVQSWKDTGLIPARRQQAVLDAARARSIELSPADFFPGSSPLEREGAAAHPESQPSVESHKRVASAGR